MKNSSFFGRLYFFKGKRMKKDQVVAAFDFDGTLTARDTLPSFLSYMFGPVKTVFLLGLEIPTLLGFVCGMTSRQKTKEKILHRFFNHLALNDLKIKGREFAEGPLNKLIRKEGLERLKWHLAQGHRCVLVSANLDVFLEPWSQKHGFHHLICSSIEASSGLVTGKIQGANCWGPEKVRRLSELLGPKENYTLYAYGDSLGDRELLELADYSFFRRF